MTTTLCIYADTDELADNAARHIAAVAQTAVGERGRFSLCLCGGDTPGPTYSRMAGPLADDVRWQNVHVFWGDERCVPLERPDNHFTLANQLLLSRVPIPPAQVHRIHADAADPRRAAAEYELELRRFFDLPSGGIPRFDLVVLGMGEDGHVASLFPGSPGLRERERWGVDHYVVKRGERVRRVTLTMPVLTAAREIMVLVAGEIKAGMLAAVLERNIDVPASELNSRATTVTWFVDREAAAELSELPGSVGETSR